ncbi:MAG: terpene cyclase/mutase family protein [Planctomycetes bacterium]|nr:terpene cyclase/mutase family protein [Planctomycetota bacterium]
MAFPYLQALTVRLAERLGEFPHDFQQRHGTYLARCQNPDGGFSGREGDSDLYYTAFGLRALAVLGQLTPAASKSAAGYLRSCLTGHANVVDFFSLLFARMILQVDAGIDVLDQSAADWPGRVAATLESFRTPDGGYGKSAGAKSGSTYHTFLVGLCYQLLDLPWPGTDALQQFLLGRQRDDGGFVEVPAMRRSGTNPTAAGVGIWHLLHGPDVPAPRQEDVIDFLAELPSDEGGFRANDRIPLADLLSTFTAAWTLEQLGALERIPVEKLRDYVYSLEQPTGGFRAGIWDEQVDIEYTFYGLGTLALVP